VKFLLNASTERNTWLEAADIVSDLYADIYAAPKGYKEHIKRQRAFVSEQDELTDRAAKLLSRVEESELSTSLSTVLDYLIRKSGRGSHRNGVYIPQPRLPNPRKPKVRIAQPQPHKPFPALHLRRTSAAVNISDSDGEERISEADRDARLA
jgi:hypothetical protein